MKKITLLFATMLAMSGMAFGQKEGKVLGEKNVESRAVFEANNSFNFLPVISPTGNVLVRYRFASTLPNGVGDGKGISAFDKDNKLLWNISEYYKNPLGYCFASNKDKKYTIITCDAPKIGRDSTLFFDKNFKYLKGFDTHTPNTFLVDVEDGVFYSDVNKTLVKYDAEAKEEWRYESEYPVNILTQKEPYLGLVFTPTEKRAILIFDHYCPVKKNKIVITNYK